MPSGQEQPDWDTILTVPRRDFSASLLLYLKLEDSEVDLDRLTEQLLEPPVFTALEEAIDVATPSEWSARQAREALRYLRRDDYILAWALLVTAVEGMYWEAAESKGLIHPSTSKILDGPRAGRTAGDAHDLFHALPINERVRRALSRYAFGSEANAFRHGRRGRWGERHQCAIWLLALITWFDIEGWRQFNSGASA